MNMSKKKFYIICVSILLLNCCFWFSFFYNKSKSEELKKLNEEIMKSILEDNDDTFEYGDDCPDFTVTTLNGKKIEINNDHRGILFISFFSPDTVKRVWKYHKYLNELCEKYRANSDNIICVSKGRLKTTKEYIKRYNIKLEIVDNNIFNLNTKLKMERFNGTIIIKNGKIEFFFRLEENLPLITQLFKKYFTMNKNRLSINTF